MPLRRFSSIRTYNQDVAEAGKWGLLRALLMRAERPDKKNVKAEAEMHTRRAFVANAAG